MPHQCRSFISSEEVRRLTAHFIKGGLSILRVVRTNNRLVLTAPRPPRFIQSYTSWSKKTVISFAEFLKNESNVIYAKPFASNFTCKKVKNILRLLDRTGRDERRDMIREYVVCFVDIFKETCDAKSS